MEPTTKLDVSLTLTAFDAATGRPFSESVQRSYGLTRAEFHALQAALSGFLLGLGKQSLDAYLKEGGAF